MVLRIEPAPNDSPTLLKLVGRIASPDVQQLKALIAEMPKPVALDFQENRERPNLAENHGHPAEVQPLPSPCND